jgi:arsenite methyltransferase
VTIAIRPMVASDADRVLAVYQAGLDMGNAGFETTAPPWETFDAAHLPAHRLVAADAGTGLVLGWVAATGVFSRCVHAGVIEHSIYVDPASHRHGIGTALLAALIRSAEDAGVWTIETGIFPENSASLRLHQRAGFRTVGTREQIGRHLGRWRDVVFLERRSKTVTSC